VEGEVVEYEGCDGTLPEGDGTAVGERDGAGGSVDSKEVGRESVVSAWRQRYIVGSVALGGIADIQDVVGRTSFGIGEIRTGGIVGIVNQVELAVDALVGGDDDIVDAFGVLATEFDPDGATKILEDKIGGAGRGIHGGIGEGPRDRFLRGRHQDAGRGDVEHGGVDGGIGTTDGGSREGVVLEHGRGRAAVGGLAAVGREVATPHIELVAGAPQWGEVDHRGLGVPLGVVGGSGRETGFGASGFFLAGNAEDKE